MRGGEGHMERVYNVRGIKELCLSENLPEDPGCLNWSKAVWKEGEVGASGRNLKFREISQVCKGFRFTQLDSVKDKLESNKTMLDL